jgi:tRNA (guanine26-N2/guanine27-N2)-dimethyltransferase
MEILTEGKAKFYSEKAAIVSRKMYVFYNPVMKANRDITVALIKAEGRKLRICDLLAGTGIRSIRLLLEAKSCIKEIAINDLSAKSVGLIKKNLLLNKLRTKKVVVANDEANAFLLGSMGFDYIDIDPFGYPGPFLESAVKRISGGGIIAVTATDTAALAGTSPKACMRKYWAMPLRNELMHEVGLRILIRRVQLTAAAYGRAAVPIYCYFKDHYMRAFFRIEKGREKADELLKMHQYVVYGNDVAGPLWAGMLWDEKLAAKILKLVDEGSRKFAGTIAGEAKVDGLFFYDIQKIAASMKINVPKTEDVLNAAKQHCKAAESHFHSRGIRAECSLEEMKRFIKSAARQT